MKLFPTNSISAILDSEAECLHLFFNENDRLEFVTVFIIASKSHNKDKKISFMPLIFPYYSLCLQDRIQHFS